MTSDNNNNNNEEEGGGRDQEEDLNSSSSPPQEQARSSNIIRNLSSEQRTRILLGLLFHRLTTTRRDDRNSVSEEDDDEGQEQEQENITTLPDRPLRILTNSEANNYNATCRFCLEQAGDESSQQITETTTTTITKSSSSSSSVAEAASSSSETTTTTTTISAQQIINNPLLSPCNCSGGSEFVHLQCFRKWQCQASLSVATRKAARICSVCCCQFHLKPLKLKSGCLRKGILLVYTSSDKNQSTTTTTTTNNNNNNNNQLRPSVTSSFDKTIVLILKHSKNGTFGLIVNSPLVVVSRSTSVVEQVSSNNLLPNCTRGIITWRRGGPVCGGRLGVSRYCLAHTFQQKRQKDVDYEGRILVSKRIFLDNNDNNNDDDDDESTLLHCHQDLQFVFDASNLHTPAMFREEELAGIIQCLTKDFQCPCQEDDDHNMSLLLPSKFLIFCGYCKWHNGQLEGEIQKGTWGVCFDTTNDDILQPEDWEQIRTGSRMKVHGDLLQEEIKLFGT